jgi:hypothetical protein
VTIPAPPKRGRPPELGAGFSPATRAWWRVVWASPMAALWQESDLYVVRRLARLVEREHAGELLGAGVLAQMSRLEDRLGLSPLGRRRLAWDLAQVSPPGVASGGERGQQRRGSDDRWLQAVKD